MELGRAQEYFEARKALDEAVAATIPECLEADKSPKDRFHDLGRSIDAMPAYCEVGGNKFVRVEFGEDAPTLTLFRNHETTGDGNALNSVMAKWTYRDNAAPDGYKENLITIEQLTLDDILKPTADSLRMLALIEESVQAAVDEFADTDMAA